MFETIGEMIELPWIRRSWRGGNWAQLDSDGYRGHPRVLVFIVGYQTTPSPDGSFHLLIRSSCSASPPFPSTADVGDPDPAALGGQGHDHPIDLVRFRPTWCK